MAFASHSKQESYVQLQVVNGQAKVAVESIGCEIKLRFLATLRDSWGNLEIRISYANIFLPFTSSAENFSFWSIWKKQNKP